MTMKTKVTNAVKSMKSMKEKDARKMIANLRKEIVCELKTLGAIGCDVENYRLLNAFGNTFGKSY
jgi:hypothetical protein